MSDCDPIGIFLVTSGTRGDRLLYRCPEERCEPAPEILPRVKINPYALKINEDLQSEELDESFNDQDLANLLAAKAALCGQKFELKINDVVFAGFPLQIQPATATSQKGKQEKSSLISFHVAFALKGLAGSFLVSCYQDLARHLAVAIHHEEIRCRYLSHQSHAMLAVQDEVAGQPEADSHHSAYIEMLKKCQLARILKKVYDDMCSKGSVQLYVNKWVHVSFCLSHKVHNLVLSDGCGPSVKPEAIEKCLSALRSYHAMLLLVEANTLIEELPIDASPSLVRLVRLANPRKNLQALACDTDLTLGQVYHLVSHLVYWGKAMIVYPLCETNVYSLAPKANISVSSKLVEKFTQQFPRVSLLALMSEFSLPSPLSDHRDVLKLPQQQAQEVKMVVWMLKHQLLVQLHTYVFLLPRVSKAGRSRHTTLPAKFLSESSTDDCCHLGIKKASSASDVISVHSDESPVHSLMFTSTKSLTEEGSTELDLMTPDTRPVWEQLTGLKPLQKRAIMSLPAARNADDLKLFARLYPYFDGQHHLEEIMYHENLSRSDLVALLDKFRSVLVMVQHEDSSISYWNQ